MDKNKFKDLIEAPALYGNEKQISLQSHIKGIIHRTLRLTLQYPELTKEYYDNLPKVVNESEQPKIN